MGSFLVLEIEKRMVSLVGFSYEDTVNPDGARDLLFLDFENMK